MRISLFSIENYKSFNDSQQLKFSPGFNILVGQNNVGKSALLEALQLRSTGKPHNSILTAPERGTTLSPLSTVDVTITVTGQELKQILANDVQRFSLPWPSDVTLLQPDGANLLKDILNRTEINFVCRLTAGLNSEPSWHPQSYPACGLYDAERGRPGENNWPFLPFRVTSEQFPFQQLDKENGAQTNEFGIAVANVCRSRIYGFHAQRFNIGESPFGANATLSANASNLPEVLSVLQGSNPARFARFNELVKQIFPSICQISVVNRGNTRVEIVVWTEDSSRQRDDLVIPLQESGTGVGQVLAILYVVINANFPTTILIDEPNSFLHPGAARKLIEILRRDFSGHQYIVSTHSVEIIRTANPETLTLIRWEKPRSVLEQFKAEEITDVQRCLVEVGAKLSDVFGADEILWVEGYTEEECYRLILDALVKEPVLGISIVAVKNTGDFENRHLSASLIWDIYKRLSDSNALIPPAVAFVFDREGRTQKDMEDLDRKSGGRVRFLSRRMYENYLISPEALEAIMADLTTVKETPIGKDKIVGWLTDNGGKKDYISDSSEHVDITNSIWLANVDGAKLMDDLFDDLSGAKEQYRKTVHSVQLTEWLIKNKAEVFDELVNLLKNILGVDTQQKPH